MQKIVKQVLETDQKYRQKGVDGDIYEIKDLKVQDWDYSLPTIIKEQNVFLKKKISELTDEQFCIKFYEKFPHLKNINWNNILVAGGCLGSILFDERHNNDIDIFLYGLGSPEEGEQKIMEICQQVVDSCKIQYLENQQKKSKKKSKKKSSESEEEEEPSFFTTEEINKVSDDVLDMVFIRKKNTFNIVEQGYNGDKYQIIFRIYKTASEVLHGFDIGSSAIGFDGRNLLFTSLSKFAYEYNCNILDTTRRSTTYEDRLKKYFQRGFEIILPKFDVNKLDERMSRKYHIPDICELPYMPFGYNRTDNKFKVTNWHKDYTQKGQDFVSDYDIDDVEEEYSLFYRNLIQLLQKKFENISYFERNNYKTIFISPKSFTKARIDYFYDELEAQISCPNKFPTSMVTKYITVDSVENIFGYRDNKKNIQKLIKEQKKEAEILMKQLMSTDIKPKFIMDNPGTQLTSSYNPVMEDAKEWYGEYFLERN